MESASSVLGGVSVLRAADLDVGRARERRRQRRLTRLAVVLAVVCGLAWWRGLTGGSLNPLGGVSLGPDAMFWLPMVLVVVVICLVMLVPMLGAYGITALVSSTSTRCVSTLQPYADASGLSISTYGQLSEEEGADNPRAVAKLIRKIRAALLHRDEPTAICVHRPVLPHILDALEMAPVTLATGAFLVSHLTREGTVHAVERHAAPT